MGLTDNYYTTENGVRRLKTLDERNAEAKQTDWNLREAKRVAAVKADELRAKPSEDVILRDSITNDITALKREKEFATDARKGEINRKLALYSDTLRKIGVRIEQAEQATERTKHPDEVRVQKSVSTFGSFNTMYPFASEDDKNLLTAIAADDSLSPSEKNSLYFAELDRVEEANWAEEDRVAADKQHAALKADAEAKQAKVKSLESRQRMSERNSDK